jgi:hypothetical protein
MTLQTLGRQETERNAGSTYRSDKAWLNPANGFDIRVKNYGKSFLLRFIISQVLNAFNHDLSVVPRT